jgi:hypothetical protein
MKFILIRELTQSELGWFLSFRETGRETSRQRGINFDSEVVKMVFPTASHADQVLLAIAYPLNDAAYAVTTNPLRRQQKNWRLVGEAIQGKRFKRITPGDLFVMAIDAVGEPFRCSFDVFPSSSKTARAITSLPGTGGHSRTGMVAIHESKADQAVRVLRGDRDLELTEDLMIARTSVSLRL